MVTMVSLTDLALTPRGHNLLQAMEVLLIWVELYVVDLV